MRLRAAARGFLPNAEEVPAILRQLSAIGELVRLVGASGVRGVEEIVRLKDLDVIKETHYTITGGFDNLASGYQSSIAGGRQNEATGQESSISGGFNNIATATYSTVSGGSNGEANGVYSTVSGGNFNVTSAYFATVSGGQSRTASGQSDWVAGTLWEDD